jgi:hypothetical protein
MLHLIAPIVPYFFPGGRAVKWFKTGLEITNSTNPLVVTKNITLMVLECCAPPLIRLLGHCIAAVGTIGASITCPNPFTIESALHFISEIYEQC